MPTNKINAIIIDIVTILAQLIAVSWVAMIEQIYFLKSLNTTKVVQIASSHQIPVEIQVPPVKTAMAIPMTKKIKNWLRVMGSRDGSPFWMRLTTSSICDRNLRLVLAWEADN